MNSTTFDFGKTKVPDKPFETLAQELRRIMKFDAHTEILVTFHFDIHGHPVRFLVEE